MKDQASSLRAIVNTTTRRNTKVLSVTSGKGGVGKTNISINLAYALSAMGRKVFLLDADLGLANVDVLLNLTPSYTIEHVLSGERRVEDIILDGPGGIKVLPSSSGVVEMAEMTQKQQDLLIKMLESIENEMDYLIIDTGAGIASNVLRFSVTADEIMLVVTPEPSSMTDAYSLIKILVNRYNINHFKVIANSVSSQAEGKQVYERLQKVTLDFLQTELGYLGAVFRDPSLTKSVRLQKPLLELYPDSPSGRCFTALARQIDHSMRQSQSPRAALTSEPIVEKPKRFWERFLKWKK